MTKHIKDDEWIKAIKEKKCPYCDNETEKKGQVKRNCNNCDFEIYGNQNPDYLAYKPLNHFELISQSECLSFISSGTHNYSYHNIDFVYICKHKRTEYDPHHDEITCLSCGTVISGPEIIREAGYRVIYPEGNRLKREINIYRNNELVKGIIH